MILEPVTFEEPRDGFLAELRRVCDAGRRAAGLRRDVDRLPAGAGRRAGALRRDAPTSPASRRRSPTACRCRWSPAARDVMALLREGRVLLHHLRRRGAVAGRRQGDHRASCAPTRCPRQLERQGDKLKAGYNALAAELAMDYTRCVGYGCRSLVAFDAKAGDPLELEVAGAAGADPPRRAVGRLPQYVLLARRRRRRVHARRLARGAGAAARRGGGRRRARPAARRAGRAGVPADHRLQPQAARGGPAPRWRRRNPWHRPRRRQRPRCRRWLRCLARRTRARRTRARRTRARRTPPSRSPAGWRWSPAPPACSGGATAGRWRPPGRW